jgi:hypothetical protein
VYGSSGECDVLGDAGERGAGRDNDDLGDGGYGGDGGFGYAAIGSLVGNGLAGAVAVSAASLQGSVDVLGADRAGWVRVGEADTAAGWWWGRWWRVAGDAERDVFDCGVGYERGVDAVGDDDAGGAVRVFGGFLSGDEASR